jgi:hypothetical protein
MLDSIEVPAGDSQLKVLEPACGDGNFLVEIFDRRLKIITQTGLAMIEAEFASLKVLASLYGIDIDKTNVKECRDRLKARLALFLDEIGASNKQAALDSACVILDTNIIEGDSINNASKILLVEYIPDEGGYFAREQSFLEEPERDLFFEEPLPLETVHYLELAK